MHPPTAAARRQRSGWFADRPIAVKIASLIAFSASVGLVLTVLATQQISTLRDGQHEIYDQNIEGLIDLGNIQRSYQGDRARYVTYELSTAEQRAALRAELAERRPVLDAAVGEYERHAPDLAAYDRFVVLLDEYYAVAQQRLVPAVDGGDTAAAAAVVTGELQAATDALMDQYSLLLEQQGEDVTAGIQAETDAAETGGVTLWTILTVSGGVGVGLMGGVGLQIGRTVR